MIVLNQINSSLLYNVAYRYTAGNRDANFVNNFFKTADNTVFHSYQRAYVWTQRNQWSALLLEDILENTIPALRYKTNSPFPWCSGTGTSTKRIIRCRFHTLLMVSNDWPLFNMFWHPSGLAHATDLFQLRVSFSSCLKTQTKTQCKIKK